MRINSISDRPAGRVALLWDESFLWGIMAARALTAAGLPFEPVRAAEIRSGCLDRCSVLFVPGGWASNKIKALGDGGVDAIRRFVHDGGSYVGFCGGAGLATMDGIGLLSVRRRPTRDRVPSFSGRIRLAISNHALWQAVAEPVFHAWWPSQFAADESVTVLATYGEALPDAFSSDVNVGDAQSLGMWPELESTYGINLDPARLMHEPAVLEGAFGEGRVLLSLVHFDTPDDRSGAQVLRNIWSYLAPRGGRTIPVSEPTPDCPKAKGSHAEGSCLPAGIAEIEEAANGLVELGLRNFLWYRRNSMLLQWRRGVRGLEYCTLQIMAGEIADLLRQDVVAADSEMTARVERTKALFQSFVEKAKRLLIKERFALQNDHITYERCDDHEIIELRDELFSKAKSHGGRFKELLDALDALLFSLKTGR